jgi:hypothetical protein
MLQEAGRSVNESQTFVFPRDFGPSAAPASVAKFSRSQ